MCQKFCVWYLAKVRLSNFFHLDENHRWDFLREERLGLTLVFNTYLWFADVVDDLERPEFHVRLDRRVVKPTTNQTLCIEHCVVWVHRHLKRTKRDWCIYSLPYQVAADVRTEVQWRENDQSQVVNALWLTWLVAKMTTTDQQAYICCLLKTEEQLVTKNSNSNWKNTWPSWLLMCTCRHTLTTNFQCPENSHIQE